ncbi:hypothetical protein PoB_001995200 [Plakobranchus ocellatus]|uniref:Uncharacterized protein n=1 Tax=Plakobranchus ocellatus TaxID=259542 RepID=A0AAV3ZG43_9GAST|nr:hypothetical protein PoB_001995200 [Plakobranchus ocellatus]
MTLIPSSIFRAKLEMSAQLTDKSSQSCFMTSHLFRTEPIASSSRECFQNPVFLPRLHARVGPELVAKSSCKFQVKFANAIATVSARSLPELDRSEQGVRE